MKTRIYAAPAVKGLNGCRMMQDDSFNKTCEYPECLVSLVSLHCYNPTVFIMESHIEAQEVEPVLV